MRLRTRPPLLTYLLTRPGAGLQCSPQVNPPPLAMNPWRPGRGESRGRKAKHKDRGEKHNRVGRVRVRHDSREKGRDNRDGHG